MTPPKPPADLREDGQAFWHAMASRYTFEPAERAILHQAARTLDELGDMSAALSTSGVTVAGAAGQIRPNPLLAQIREHRKTFERMVECLGIPPTGETTGSRAATRKARAKGRIASVQYGRNAAAKGGA